MSPWQLTEISVTLSVEIKLKLNKKKDNIKLLEIKLK